MNWKRVYDYTVIFYDKEENEIDKIFEEAFTPEEAYELADKDFSKKYDVMSCDEIVDSYEVVLGYGESK